MNNKVVIGTIILVVVLAGGYFAVKAIKHSANPTPAPVVQQQTTQPTTSATSPTASAVSTSPVAMQTINVSGTDFAFSPSTIKIKNGQPVKIVFVNNGKLPHNFNLTDLNVKTKTIMPGQTDSVTFTPAKTGSFTYICTVPGHAYKGMTGILTVN